jgi:hypothetical protein
VTLATQLAILVVGVAVPLNFYVMVVLWRLSRKAPWALVLRVQAVSWTSLTLIVAVFAAVFLNNELEMPPLDNEATKIVTRGALLVLSIIPAVYWLRAVWRRQ